MASTVNLKNNNNDSREGFVGFSWTTLLSGPFVPWCRDDMEWHYIMLICDLCTFALAGFIFAFIYNEIYTRNLLHEGYFPADDHSRQLLIQAGLISVPQQAELKEAGPIVQVVPEPENTAHSVPSVQYFPDSSSVPTITIIPFSKNKMILVSIASIIIFSIIYVGITNPEKFFTWLGKIIEPLIFLIIWVSELRH